MGQLVGIHAATLQKTRNCQVSIDNLDLICQKVASLTFPTQILAQTTAVKHTQSSSQLSFVPSEALFISKLRHDEARVKPFYLLLVLWFDSVEMLNKSNNFRQAQTAKQVDCGISCLIECSSGVERVFSDFLGIGGECRYDWTHNVCTFCQIYQLSGLSLRSHNEEPIPEGAANGSRKDLQGWERVAGIEIFSYCQGWILFAVKGKRGHDWCHICGFIAGDEEHDAYLVLSFHFFSNCSFCWGIEVFIGGGDAFDLSFLLRGFFFDAALLERLFGLLALDDGLRLAVWLLLGRLLFGRLWSLEFFVLLLVGTGHSGHCWSIYYSNITKLS